MATIHEIAPDVYRISVFWPEIDLSFNHFLVKDDEPLLFHTGLRRMFPEVREAVAKLIDQRLAEHDDRLRIHRGSVAGGDSRDRLA